MPSSGPGGSSRHPPARGHAFVDAATGAVLHIFETGLGVFEFRRAQQGLKPPTVTPVAFAINQKAESILEREGLAGRHSSSACPDTDEIGSQQAGGLTLCRKQRDRLLIERYKSIAAEPLTLESDHAIGEIAPGFEHSQSGFSGRPVRFRIRCTKQCTYCSGNIRRSEAVHTTQHPNEFAETRQCDSDHFRARQQLGGCVRLFCIVAHNSAN